MSPAAVALSRVSKVFGATRALDDVTLDISAGEIFALVGPNGAGKTTMMRILTGLIAPTSGHAEVLDAAIPARYEDVAGRIGALIGEPRIYGHLSAAGNIRIAARLAGIEDDPDPSGRLHRLGVDASDRRAARKLSTGTVQRIALAMAMVGDPELLILDEPTSGMDPRGSAEFQELLQDLKEQGTTVILSSHQMHEVEAVADRVAFLSGGRAVAVGTLDQLLSGGERVLVEVTDVAGALDLLQKAGIPSTMMGQSEIACDAEIGAVLRAFAEGSVSPRSVREDRVSLTEMFMRMSPGQDGEST